MNNPEIVSMQIVKERPPMFDRIRSVFPMAANPGVMFCFGDMIYNPSGIDVPPHLIAHETVHRAQQGMAVELWWEKYLTDPMFRFAQELPAHIKEYQQFCIGQPRPARRIYLRIVAERLSGPLYGGMIDYAHAKELIRLEARHG